jgi:hypothetical protein
MIKQKLKLMVVKVDSFGNYRPRYKKDLLLLIYFSEGRTGNKQQISDAKTRQQQQQFLLSILIQKFKEQKNKSSKNKRIRI